MSTIVLFLVTLPVLLVVDIIWIGVIASRFYRDQLGSLFAPSVNWPAAIAFYLIYAAAIVFFVLMPSLARQSLLYAVLVGGFLGLVAYATYDLTNLVVIKDWPFLMSIVDMVWGAFMTAMVSGAVYLIATSFLGR
jgi:uncharacterized membrane protein